MCGFTYIKSCAALAVISAHIGRWTLLPCIPGTSEENGKVTGGGDGNLYSLGLVECNVYSCFRI